MLDPDRPIYRQAPLKLVAFQINFPPQPVLDAGNPPQDLANALKERFPIFAGPSMLQVDLGPGGGAPRPRGSRMMNRERTWTISMSSESVAIETSRYQRYERFANQLDWVLERVHEHVGIPAVTRLGLRYIDEIVVEGAEELADWKPWITGDLLAGGLIDGYQTQEYLATAVLEVADDQRMTVRYGRVRQPVVDPNGPLRILSSPTGPYFLLDLDSYWEPSTDEFREFNPEEVREVTMRLHDPVRDIFERAITDELREQFGPESQVGS